MRPANFLFILSDQHKRDLIGAYGDRVVSTPNLDRLAARGTRFNSAYTNCPICVPARASLATGTYVHVNRCWDNAQPCHGQLPAWGHHLIDAGHEVVSVGKLHYRSTEDANGFSREIMPMHVLNGEGDILGMLRDPLAPRRNVGSLAKEAGRGESTYATYDSRIADAACDWLRREAPSGGRPWVLFTGFVLPHFPLIAPPAFYDRHPPETLPSPRLYKPEERPTHPVLDALGRCLNYDDFFDDERVGEALRAYYGMVAYLDHNVGRVLAALEASGAADRTRIIYTSDHGDSLGNRGLWGKFVMYEESAAVPLIIGGPDVPAGRSVDTPVSLVDMYPTIVNCVGESLSQTEHALPGRSLWDIATADDDRERVVLSEYHAVGSITGYVMIRQGRWKYVHYVGNRPQLFDLAADPGETRDLGESTDHRDLRSTCEAALRAIVDPEEASAAAFWDQAQLRCAPAVISATPRHRAKPPCSRKTALETHRW